MHTLSEIATQKIATLAGKNVRCPSLVIGLVYACKDWETGKYDALEFLGCGTEVNTVFTARAENFKLKEMNVGDQYRFKAVDSKGEAYTFVCYMSENCLVMGTGASRATFYQIEGLVYPESGSSSPAKAAKPRRKLEVAVVDEEEDLGVWGADEEDDGEPIGIEVHRYSMQPLDKTAPRTRF